MQIMPTLVQVLAKNVKKSQIVSPFVSIPGFSRYNVTKWKYVPFMGNNQSLCLPWVIKFDLFWTRRQQELRQHTILTELRLLFTFLTSDQQCKMDNITTCFSKCINAMTSIDQITPSRKYNFVSVTLTNSLERILLEADTPLEFFKGPLLMQKRYSKKASP